MAEMPPLVESRCVATGSKMRVISPVRPRTGEATLEPVDNMRCVVDICSTSQLVELSRNAYFWRVAMCRLGGGRALAVLPSLNANSMKWG